MKFRDAIERGELKSNLLFRDGHLQLNVKQIRNKRKCDSWYDQDRMMEQLANQNTNVKSKEYKWNALLLMTLIKRIT